MKKHCRMLVFDLDGTLAQLNAGILPEDILKLKKLETQGFQLVICSGKSTFYLSGILRQTNLMNTILIGENGCVFQFGGYLPPQKYYIHPCPSKAFSQLELMRERISSTCKSRVWYQPNTVALTSFPRDPETFETIQHLVDIHSADLTELTVYRHADSFDFMPKDISKYSALSYLSELTDVSADEMISIGDGVNDIPMFKYTGKSIVIGETLDYPGTYRFKTIGEALNFLCGL